MVFAYIEYENDEILPYGYRRKEKGYMNKDLLQPIPGLYQDDYKNPFLFNDTVIPILTNDTGHVVFTDLAFSVYG